MASRVLKYFVLSTIRMEWTFSCKVAVKEPVISEAGLRRCGASVLDESEACHEGSRRCRCRTSVGSDLCTFHASSLAKDVQTYKALPVSASVRSVYAVCDAYEQESDATTLEMLRNCYGGHESVSTSRVFIDMEAFVVQLRACSTEREVVQKRYFRYTDFNRTAASHVHFYTLQRKQADCIERVLQRLIRGREKIKAALALKTFTPPPGEAGTGIDTAVGGHKGKMVRKAKVFLNTETLETLHGGDKILAFRGLGHFTHLVFIMLQKLIDTGSWVLLPVTIQAFEAYTGGFGSLAECRDYYMYVAKLGGVYVCTLCFLGNVHFDAHTLCLPIGWLKASSTLFGVLHSLFVHSSTNYILRRALCGRYSQLRRALSLASIRVQATASPGQIVAEHANWFQFIDRIFQRKNVLDEDCFGKGLYVLLRSNEFDGMSRLLPEICGFLKTAGDQDEIDLTYTDYVPHVNSAMDCARHGLPDVEFNLLAFQTQTYGSILGRKSAASNFRSIHTGWYQFTFSSPIGFSGGIWWIIRHNWWLDCIEQD